MFFTKGDILCVHTYIGCCILGVNKINRRKQRSENADKVKNYSWVGFPEKAGAP